MPVMPQFLAMGCIIAATAACAQVADVVFEDAFDAAGVSPHWRVVSGEWTSEDSVLTNGAPSDATLVAGDRTWDDYTLSVRLRTDIQGPKPWSVARVLLRYTDSGNTYYLVLHATGMLELGKEHRRKHMPGLVTVKDCGRPMEWHTLVVHAKGARITVELDDRECIAFEDPDPLASGLIGLDAFQNSRVRFDDVRVTSPEIVQRVTVQAKKRQESITRLGYRRASAGNIAIFEDPDAPQHDSAHSDPDHIQKVLSAAGYGATLLPPEDQADPNVLSAELFDALVLPYGSAFPRKAVVAFRRYLREGGCFLSVGGYFGDYLYSDQDDDPLTRLIVNPGFESELQSWGPTHPDAPGVHVVAQSALAHGGERAAKLEVTPKAKIEFYSLAQRVEGLKPGATVHVQAWARTDSIRDGHGAYLALNYFREDGERIRWDQSAGLVGTREWTPVRLLGTVPAGTSYATVNLLLHGHGTAWFDDVQAYEGAPGSAVLNTREGDVKGPGNSLRVSPEQIGLFDPGYRLEDVTHLQWVGPSEAVATRYSKNGEFQGYSASGLFIGNGNPVRAQTYARPTDLLAAHDELGRRRGTAGTLVRNYRGPWAGSNWAAFGVSNIDLFSPGDPQGEELLLASVRALLRRTYVAQVGAQYACYRTGEPIKLQALIANHDPKTLSATVRFTVHDHARPGKPLYSATAVAQATGLSRVETIWQPGELSADLLVVRAELIEAGRTVDTMDGGVVIWRDDVVAAAPAIEISDGYLARDGRTAFLCGTGESGYPYFADSEGPLVWDEQFRLMRDMGLRYYRCMHFFSCYPTGKPLETLDDLPAEQLRRLDAMVYLAHKRGLMFLFVNNVGLQLARDDADDLAGRMRALTLLAKRYRNARGFVFNMDHQEFIRRGNPLADKAFRRAIEDQWGSYAEFARAWGLPEQGGFEDLLFDEALSRGKPWSSPASLGMGRFLHDYREAWRRNAAQAIHSGNPKAVYDQDFSLYWWPDYPWPGPDTMPHLNMSSAHFYGDEGLFGLQVKRADMQVLGMPLGQTEFGILTHPAWQGHRDCRLDHDAADGFFAMATHYCLGTGATMLSNWNWKEMKECIFPWAVAHHDLVPKQHLLAYRNMALLMSTFSPKYMPPEVFVVVPSSHLLTNQVRAVDQALRECIRRLMSLRVRFSLIGEGYLDRLPSSARALLYPVPFCAPDATIEHLEAFVRRGGCLYFSGDISFDPMAQRTRTDRLERLAGVRFGGGDDSDLSAASTGKPCIKVEPIGAEVLLESQEGPRAVLNRVGKGSVLAILEPIEATRTHLTVNLPGQDAVDVYEAVLRLSGASRIPAQPDGPALHTFEISTQASGTVTVVFNSGDTQRMVALGNHGHELKLTVLPHRPALAHFAADGRLLSVECQQEALLDGQPLFVGDGHWILHSLDGTSLDRSPQQVLAMCVGQGKARVPALKAMKGPRVRYGEFRSKKWVSLRTDSSPAGDRSIECAGPLRSAVVIAAAGDKTAEAVERVEALLQP